MLACVLPLCLACKGEPAIDDFPDPTGGFGGDGGTGGVGATGGAVASGGDAQGGGGGVEVGGAGGGGDAPVAPRVLIVAPDGAGKATDLAFKLEQTGSFEAVDVFDLGAGFCPEEVATPTLAELQAYDVALVFLESAPQPRFALGDVLADYFDAGGRVVTGMIPIGGRFAGLTCSLAGPCAVGCNPGGKKYGVIPLSSPMGDSGAPDALGEVLEPDSPLVQEVSTWSVSTPIRFSGATLAPTSAVVAEWASGAPLIVRGVVDGRARVDLNLFPPSDDTDPTYGWDGDGVALLKNALLYGE